MDKYQQYEKHWENAWMTCGRKETATFESNNIGYTESLIVGNGRRKLMVWIYCLLRNYKKIKPIEDLEPDVKKQMWAFVKEVCAGKTEDIPKMKQIAMVFYAIEYFLNENCKYDV